MGQRMTEGLNDREKHGDGEWYEGVEWKLLTFPCHSAWGWVGEVGWWWHFQVWLLFPPLTPQTNTATTHTPFAPPSHHFVTGSWFSWKDDITLVTVFNQMSLSFHRTLFLGVCLCLCLCVCMRVPTNMSLMSLPVLAGAEDLSLWGHVTALWENMNKEEGVRVGQKIITVCVCLFACVCYVYCMCVL